MEWNGAWSSDITNIASYGIADLSCTSHSPTFCCKACVVHETVTNHQKGPFLWNFHSKIFMPQCTIVGLVNHFEMWFTPYRTLATFSELAAMRWQLGPTLLAVFCPCVPTFVLASDIAKCSWMSSNDLVLGFRSETLICLKHQRKGRSDVQNVVSTPAECPKQIWLVETRPRTVPKSSQEKANLTDPCILWKPVVGL